MNYKDIVIFSLSFGLIILILLIIFFSMNLKNNKNMIYGLLGSSFLSILAIGFLIVTILGFGINQKHAILLKGYSKLTYDNINDKIVESGDYTFHLDLNEIDTVEKVIAVKKKGIFYQVIENEYETYYNENYKYGNYLYITTFKLESNYIHFLNFQLSYFEEVGHLGNLLPDSVYINGEEIDVYNLSYCFSDEEIINLNVNGYDFVEAN